MRRCLALILVLLVSAPAAARVYEWASPASGTVHLTGIPPSWYRNGDASAPRVRVYDNGRLIDDTAIALSAEDRQELREAAFRDLEQRRQIEAVRRLERAARRQAARQAEAKEESAASAAEEQAAGSDADAPNKLPESLDAAMVERLKSIISEYDRVNAAPADEEQPAPRGSNS